MTGAIGRTHRRLPPSAGVEPYAILAALPAPVLVVDESDRMDYVNAAAEQFFETSAVTLTQCSLGDFLPHDSPVFALIESVRHSGHSVSEYGVTLDTPQAQLACRDDPWRRPLPRTGSMSS